MTDWLWIQHFTHLTMHALISVLHIILITQWTEIQNSTISNNTMSTSLLKVLCRETRALVRRDRPMLQHTHIPWLHFGIWISRLHTVLSYDITGHNFTTRHFTTIHCSKLQSVHLITITICPRAVHNNPFSTHGIGFSPQIILLIQI